ncbi:MAG: glucose-6-phosphate isomerase [Armatimonadetes bacterium]|nr:glucose-6-phosphate isomerase [Armatimonadota bacterium]
MLDLSELAGYRLKFDEETCSISLGSEMRMPQYSTRELSALAKVLEDPAAEGPEVIYWMYRNTGRKTEAGIQEAYDLRYDLSSFRSVMLGREYMKTSGHYHPNIPGEDVAYPEIYEVLYGEALYIMQKVADYGAAPDEVEIEDVIIARVTAGQKIIMPPGYGHVTVNTLDKPLLMSNWVSSRFSSFYGSVETCRGFGWYVVAGDDGPQYERNPHYVTGVPDFRVAEPREVPELGIVWDKPMYTACAEDPDRFAFLNDPAGYDELVWANLEIQ